MMVCTASILFLVGIASAGTLDYRHTTRSLLLPRACNPDSQYYCRYGFCCDHDESCELEGCGNRKAQCSKDGQVCDFGCCNGTKCGTDGLCHCVDPNNNCPKQLNPSDFECTAESDIC